MKRPAAASVALCLLRRVSGGAYGEALCGDVLEEFERTGARGRFWREIAAGVMRGVWRWCAGSLQPVAFSAGWSLLYPVWQAMEGGRVWPALANRSYAMAWPYSSVALLASGGLSPLLFVWLGALLYLLRNGRGRWALRWFGMVRGLSVSLSVLLVSWMVLMRLSGGEGLAGHLSGEAATARGVPVSWLTVSLMLSLLVATFPARPLRVRVR